MNIKEIQEVKGHLNLLKSNGVIREWNLPYENLLTRLSAAIFFITPEDKSGDEMGGVSAELSRYDYFSYRPNSEKKLSDLLFRITFSKEEMEKNAQEPIPSLL